MYIINNIKGKEICFFALVIIAAALFFNIVMHNFFINEKGQKVSCISFFTILSNVRTEGVLTLKIDGEGRGMINISGGVKDTSGSMKYNILRKVDFSYRHDENGYITMQDIFITKKISDNMPDRLFNESVFDFSSEKRRLRITELGNGYLLWNAFSPVLICTHNI